MMTKPPRENRVPIMMSEEELAAIDDWRFKNRVATRSDAVRRLTKMALVVDEARSGFSDTMGAKGEAESAVFKIAMDHIWELIKSDDSADRRRDLLEVVRNYTEADAAFIETLRLMFDDLNFYRFADNPFVTADRLSEEKEKTLLAVAKAVGISDAEPEDEA